MRILFQSRKTLFDAPGGDTIQLLKTKEYLEKLGLEIDISTELTPSLYKYDIVHVFNLMRGQESLMQVMNAKKQGKKVALSTIYGLYTDFERYGRNGLSKYVFRLLSPFQIEYVKIAARTFLGGELHKGSIQMLLTGYYHTLRKIVRNTDVFLPNSVSEMNRVIADYKLDKPLYEAIPNAVDTAVFDPEKVQIDDELRQYEGCILSVARIEGRKCQLELVQAVKETDYKLVIIGKPGKNAQGYYEAVKAAAGGNVTFIQHLDHERLPQFYKLAKVHALISWMETPGLSSLEAGVMGANLVITPNGDTRDYFGDMAEYCTAGDVESIKAALGRAYNRPANGKLRDHILENFTWQKAAAATLAAYNKIKK